MHNHTLLLALEALPSPVPSPSTVHGLGDAGDKVEARGLHILSHMHTHTHACMVVFQTWWRQALQSLLHQMFIISVPYSAAWTPPSWRVPTRTRGRLLQQLFMHYCAYLTDICSMFCFLLICVVLNGNLVLIRQAHRTAEIMEEMMPSTTSGWQRTHT